MDKTKQSINLEVFATETLDQFEEVSYEAKKALKDGSVSAANVFASVNTMTDTSAILRYEQTINETRKSYEMLVNEPAIARVVVADGEGETKTYYICRTAAPSGIKNCASYHAPIGRMASLPIGSEYTLPNGTTLEILEQAKLRPVVDHGHWDSRDTIIESESFGPVTIESLIALIKGTKDSALAENLLDQILAEENQRANIIGGMRRSVITKMALRDQPILDQYQDEIFRLPLDKRLVILGPPGTGKTTTLIRRLGQKLNTAFLDENEQDIVKSVGVMNGLSHADSWLMFTPTELLR